MFYTGSLWKFVEGEAEGQTATDCNRIDQESIFSHPIDLHLACRGIQGEADKNEIMRKRPRVIILICFLFNSRLAKDTR